MQAFRYSQARTVDGAVQTGGASGAAFLAGGTTLVDLMKLDVMTPQTVVDINSLPLDQVESLPGGGRTHWSDGAQQRSGEPCADPTEICGAVGSAAVGRFAAVAEYGDDGR